MLDWADEPWASVLSLSRQMMVLCGVECRQVEETVDKEGPGERQQSKGE